MEKTSSLSERSKLSSGVTVKILATLFALSSFAAWSGTSKKLEGTCTGTLKNKTPIAFTYYSNFDGCKNTSSAAITFTSGVDGLLTGTRSFKNNKDVYVFPKSSLIFDDSTGNTEGTLKVFDGRANQTIQVQCEVRDYEYGEC